jgi:DNA-binding MarR family transcriptional regulator
VGSKLQREIQQSKPFASPRQEATLGLLRTADVIRRRIASVVEPYGITTQQYNVLRILRGAGPAGLPVLTIAGRLIESTPGMTRLLDRLVKKGLVRREHSQSDRRQVICVLTPAGHELLRRVDPVVVKADETLLGHLEETRIRTLIRLLDDIRE